MCIPTRVEHGYGVGFSTFMFYVFLLFLLFLLFTLIVALFVFSILLRFPALCHALSCSVALCHAVSHFVAQCCTLLRFARASVSAFGDCSCWSTGLGVP